MIIKDRINSFGRIECMALRYTLNHPEIEIVDMWDLT